MEQFSARPWARRHGLNASAIRAISEFGLLFFFLNVNHSKEVGRHRSQVTYSNHHITVLYCCTAYLVEQIGVKPITLQLTLRWNVPAVREVDVTVLVPSEIHFSAQVHVVTSSFSRLFTIWYDF